MEIERYVNLVHERLHHVSNDIIGPVIKEAERSSVEVFSAQSLTDEGLNFTFRLLTYPWWRKYASSKRGGVKIFEWAIKNATNSPS